MNKIVRSGEHGLTLDSAVEAAEVAYNQKLGCALMENLETMAVKGLRVKHKTAILEYDRNIKPIWTSFF